jgi:hypothetical protein
LSHGFAQLINLIGFGRGLGGRRRVPADSWAAALEPWMTPQSKAARISNL